MGHTAICLANFHIGPLGLDTSCIDNRRGSSLISLRARSLLTPSLLRWLFVSGAGLLVHPAYHWRSRHRLYCLAELTGILPESAILMQLERRLKRRNVT